MALYEYRCETCGTRFEKRMPMSQVVQFLPCPKPKCGKQAKKLMANFAVVGKAEAGFGDGPAPWDGEGPMGGDMDMGMGMGGDSHGHSHGAGGHSH